MSDFVRFRAEIRALAPCGSSVPNVGVSPPGTFFILRRFGHRRGYENPGPLHRRLLGLGGRLDRPYPRHARGVHETPRRPLVVHVGAHRAHQPHQRGLGGEHLDGVGPALYLPVRPLLDVVRPQAQPVLGGEPQVAQRVLPGVLEQLAGAPLDRADLLDRPVVHRPDQPRVALLEDGRHGPHGPGPVALLRKRPATSRSRWVMQRCQLASGYTSAIALTSPAWSSLVTHLTPSTPRRRSPSRNARHDPRDSVSTQSSPTNLRLPSEPAAIAVTTARPWTLPSDLHLT